MRLAGSRMRIPHSNSYNFRLAALRLGSRQLDDHDNPFILVSLDIAAREGLCVLHKGLVLAGAARNESVPGRLGGSAEEDEGGDGGDVCVCSFANLHDGFFLFLK